MVCERVVLGKHESEICIGEIQVLASMGDINSYGRHTYAFTAVSPIEIQPYPNSISHMNLHVPILSIAVAETRVSGQGLVDLLLRKGSLDYRQDVAVTQ